MSSKSLYEAIGIIFAILAIITGTITIILTLIKLVGNSPDFVTIALWAVSTIITIVITGIMTLLPMKGDIERLKEFQRQTITEVKNLKEIQKEILNEIKKSKR